MNTKEIKANLEKGENLYGVWGGGGPFRVDSVEAGGLCVGARQNYHGLWEPSQTRTRDLGSPWNQYNQKNWNETRATYLAQDHLRELAMTRVRDALGLTSFDGIGVLDHDAPGRPRKVGQQRAFVVGQIVLSGAALEALNVTDLMVEAEPVEAELEVEA